MKTITGHISKRKIDDVGLQHGVDNLTPDRIQEVVQQVFKGETGARLQAYSEMCVRCGLCSEACHFCLSHDKDPSYSPVGKVKQTIWPLLKNNGRVSPEFVYQMAQVAYTECNLCKRCVQYCPFGIDTAYMMQIVRRICHKLGVTPQYLQDTAHSHAATMNQMWVKDDEWTDTLLWQEEEARDELPDLRIPLDKEGADIFYSVIGPEPKFRTQLIYQAAVLMHATGQNWTMPSTPGWDNSDMAMYSGDSELMGRLKRQHFESAMNLRCKKIVMGECGHAFRSVYDMGNRWLGWKSYPIEVMHAIEFYWELMEAGKLKVAKTFDKVVTLHDPCNISRGRGLHEKAREVVRAFCPNFIEMIPNREHNYCCSAGGGVINCGPPFKNTRVSGNTVKADQLRNTGAEVCIAPCHNCHGGLEDIIHDNKLDMKLMFLIDIIYECMEK